MPLPTPTPPTPPHTDNERDTLLTGAGLTPSRKVALTQKTIDRLEAMLDAEETKFFAFQGQVGEVRRVPDHETRLKAVEASYRLLGIAAPKQDQKITVVYKLELPSWAQADTNTAPQVIEIEGKVE